MSDLREKLKNLNATTCPCDGFSHAVRDLLTALAERVEPETVATPLPAADLVLDGATESVRRRTLQDDLATRLPASDAGMPLPVSIAVDALVAAAGDCEDEEGIAVYTQAADDLWSWWRSQPTATTGGVTEEMVRVIAYATNRSRWRRETFPNDQREADRMDRDIAAVRAQLAAQPVPDGATFGQVKITPGLPELCYTPAECAGRTSCPRRPSCSS